LLSNLEVLKDKFKPDFAKQVTNDDISEYIQGVTSNSSLFMISELYNSLDGGIESINGLGGLVQKIEEHYMYF
jgi:hypothetical protein